MTVADLVASWIEERLAAEPADEVPSRACLVPRCDGKDYTRGLCAKHRARVRYLERKGLITEGFLVLHGRMKPALGRTLSDYVDEEPGKPPAPDLVTLWLFGKDVFLKDAPPQDASQAAPSPVEAPREEVK